MATSRKSKATLAGITEIEVPVTDESERDNATIMKAYNVINEEREAKSLPLYLVVEPIRYKRPTIRKYPKRGPNANPRVEREVTKNRKHTFEMKSLSTPTTIRIIEEAKKKNEEKNKKISAYAASRLNEWDGIYAIVSNSYNMPNVLRAVGIFPENWEVGTQILVIPRRLLEISAKSRKALADMTNAGTALLYDEREDGAVLRAQDFDDNNAIFKHARIHAVPRIEYLGEELDKDFAYQVLRERFLDVAASLWLMPFIVGRRIGHVPLESISDKIRFAKIITLGKHDFSVFQKKANGKFPKWKTNIFVSATEFNERCIPDSLEPALDAVKALRDFGDIWSYIMSESWLAISIDPQDIQDENTGIEKMNYIADIVGMETFVDAYRQGVPLDAILRKRLKYKVRGDW